MGASNINTRVALGISAVCVIMFFIAFVSPYWLVTDGRVQEPRFRNLGLWTVCFNNFRDINRFYDTPFHKCMWVFEEEFYIIHDFLLPGFYVAVQLFATLCFVMCLLSLPMTLFFLRTSRDDDRYMLLLSAMGICQILASIFGFIAVVIFGLKGDSRDWMPGWQNNDMGWAYAFAVIGAVMLFPAGVMYGVEARRERYKRLNEVGNREISEYGGNAGDDIYAPPLQQQEQPYYAGETSRPRRPAAGQRIPTAPPSAEEGAVGGGGIQTDI